jgi:lipoyl(octanoyl) transferase
VALNVENDLATFDHTVPCGIDGVTMSTVVRECERAGCTVPSFAQVSAAVQEGVASVFILQLADIPPSIDATLRG